MDKLINDVKTAFKNTFKIEPLMIFSPGRINIIGEHTDYNEGYVFPAAVNKGIVAAFQKSDSGKCTVHALDMDNSIEFSLDEITPDVPGSWTNYILGVIAEIQNRSHVIGNFNMVFKGDIPAGSGMSSSAALENSVAFGLNELFNLGLSKHDMIHISQKAEHNYVGVKCGIMDQYASMFGIQNNALLLDCRTLESTPFEINFKNHQLVLINTNVKHSLSDSAYNDRRSVCENVSALLGIKTLRDASENDLLTVQDKLTPENYQKALYIIQENERAIKAGNAMKEDDLESLGNLIYASHNGLQHQYQVSCDELDFLVEQAKLNKHVLGARMMGGGFGGCTINLVAKEKAEDFTKTVSLAYLKKFNKACSVYHVELSDGTHKINN